MEIFTSFYSNQEGILQAMSKGFIPVRISLGAPRFATRYQIKGEAYLLMPSREMLHKARPQYEPEYLARLDSYGVEKIQSVLDKLAKSYGAKGLILLCFEDLRKGEWCHRTMFGEWWMKKTGQLVEELEIIQAPKVSAKPAPTPATAVKPATKKEVKAAANLQPSLFAEADLFGC
jgi:hypothetical protein